MKPALDRNDREFLEHLHQLEPVTVLQLCQALGVTATAVRQRLTRLQNSVLVSRHVVRSGRGRPHHVYGVTAAGRKLLGDNYSELAVVLWREIQRIDEPDVRSRIKDRIRDSLASLYGSVVSGRSVHERVGQLGAALKDLGFDVETDDSGPFPILRENHCPYPDLSDCDPTICGLEQDVFGRILGTPVTLTRCCRDGYSCCEFQAG